MLVFEGTQGLAPMSVFPKYEMDKKNIFWFIA